jgi:hypothetical protein
MTMQYESLHSASSPRAIADLELMHTITIICMNLLLFNLYASLK